MSLQTVAQKLQYPLPVPEPGVTPEKLVERAAAFRQAIRAAQDEDDLRGCHSPAMDLDFRKAGFYRILQPKLFGGYEFDYVTFYRVMLEIARGSPGVCWCLALAATHGALVGFALAGARAVRILRRQRGFSRAAPRRRRHQHLRARRRRLHRRRGVELLLGHSLRHAFLSAMCCSRMTAARRW